MNQNTKTNCPKIPRQKCLGIKLPREIQLSKYHYAFALTKLFIQITQTYKAYIHDKYTIIRLSWFSK